MVHSFRKTKSVMVERTWPQARTAWWQNRRLVSTLMKQTVHRSQASYKASRLALQEVSTS